MRRVRIELTEVAAIPNLIEATARAARGKRERPVVRAFLDRLEAHLAVLAEDIVAGRAPRGEYRCFRIRDPKPRVIQCVQQVMYPYAMLDAWPSDAPYNDRKSRLVFIVRDVPQGMIEQAFEMFCGVRDSGAPADPC